MLLSRGLLRAVRVRGGAGAGAAEMAAAGRQRAPLVLRRPLSGSGSGSGSEGGNPLGSLLSNFVAADKAKMGVAVHHAGSKALLVLLPATLLCPDAMYMFRYVGDLGLALLLPLHGHIGINYVISDYVPKAMRSTARMGAIGIFVVAALGLVIATHKGQGPSMMIKGLWTTPKEMEKRRAAAAAHSE